MKYCPALIVFLALLASAQIDAPPSATSYPSHVTHYGNSIGAKVLTADELRHASISGIKHCCVVVEVALYPRAGESLQISPGDFSLKAPSQPVVKPINARHVVALLQKPIEPDTGPSITRSVNVGYETGGFDPTTGMRVPGGVYSGAGVGVGLGGSGNPPPNLGSENQALEQVLDRNALPEGTISAPMAGYLYFPLAGKKKKKANYQLVVALDGEKLLLAIPSH